MSNYAPYKAAGDTMKRKALFLDRDGVINKDFGYVCEIERLEYVDGIFELCRKAKSKSYLIIVITNQAGIGRGYYSEQQFLDFMDIIKHRFTEENCAIDAFYYCPHHPSAAISTFKKTCQCRKPGPGMFAKACTEHNLNLLNSIMIGDKISDYLAAENAGVATSYILSRDVKSVASATPTLINHLSSVKI